MSKISFKINVSKPLSPIDLLRAKAEKVVKASPIIANAPSKLLPLITLAKPSASTKATSIPESSEIVALNQKQMSFIGLVKESKPCVLLGAAGTGKTTCVQELVQYLIQANIGLLEGDHKTLMAGSPAIVGCAFTNRAVNNMAKALPSDLRGNFLTIHKLLEYAPVYFDVEDEETGKICKTMEFMPSRGINNKLDSSIKVVIIEEASMVDTELYAKLVAALLPHVQIILLGDIQQLPPVFGSAILGFKMLEWDVVELTHVYRQALDSPIIRLAHRILSGKPILQKELVRDYPNEVGSALRVIPWPKPLLAEKACEEAFKLMRSAYDEGKYIPEEHTVLIPYNKAFGTLEFNNCMANHIAKKIFALTHEVIVGYQTRYFSAGDYILQNKREATILSIEVNQSYVGKPYKNASETLDYWGYDKEALPSATSDFSIDVDSFLDALVGGEEEERKLQVSHTITIQYQDTQEIVKLSTLGDIQQIIFAYALTVHKSQGSEWSKVFLFLHKSHNTMLQRELLYTAVTRAKKELVIVCEANSFIKGITNQKIKGNTLEEKAEFFKGKLENKSLQS